MKLRTIAFLLIFLSLATGLAIVATSVFLHRPIIVQSMPTLDQQTQHLEQVLWYNVQLFHLEGSSITISAMHDKDMRSHSAWGDCYPGPNGNPVIEILAVEDYPSSTPLAQRQVYQEGVVMHEVLHIVLHQIELPAEAQDAVIETLRPMMRQYVRR
jgi:hypothetical protein